MSQITLSEKGIGPFQHNGYNYWVEPASDRVLCSWTGKEFFDKRKPKKGIRLVPSKEELNEVIYKNMKQIDEVDNSIGDTTSPSLANIVAGTARDGSNSRSTPWVWSSTVCNDSNAWYQSLSDGLINVNNKNFKLWIVGINKEPIKEVTLSEKGIGPFEYNGYNYFVAPASERMISGWPGNKVDINGKTWDTPTKDELNNVVYQNRGEIDITDTTSGTKLSDIANGPYTVSNGWNWVWSSTEHSSYEAQGQRFSAGSLSFNNKISEGWVVGIYKEPIGKEQTEPNDTNSTKGDAVNKKFKPLENISVRLFAYNKEIELKLFDFNHKETVYKATLFIDDDLGKDDLHDLLKSFVDDDLEKDDLHDLLKSFELVALQRFIEVQELDDDDVMLYPETELTGGIKIKRVDGNIKVLKECVSFLTFKC